MRQFVQLSLVHTDVDVTCRMHQYVHQFCITHRRQRFMCQCVHLHSLLTMMVHMSACKPINVYKLTCLLMQFLLMLALLASVQAVCTPAELLLAYVLCFADVDLACVSLYACYCKHTHVDIACRMRQYVHQIHRTHGCRPACVCMFC
jgi:hypothetical protein